MISQSNEEYIQCLRNISDSFGIPIQLMELLIDIITGQPTEIFKVTPKEVHVNLELNSISGEFDSTRLAMLSELFKASKQTLSKTFILWYKSYKLV